MQCKFLKHGLAISYDHVVKPCCEWQQDINYSKQNHISQVDLTTWHQKNIVFEQQLASDVWPSACARCEHREKQQRNDSIRLSGEQAYAHYADDDITLEIRPGNVCNFSCQTCWPEASSRVSQHHAQAGLIDIKSINSTRIDDFDFLLPIADRIQDVVLLGGEPFYDPNCKRFLAWAHDNLHSNITMFTNGSTVNWDWVESYAGKITMVFSIDAVGKAAEYVRFGTDWDVVLKNFEQARVNPKISLRVNVTTSIYNYYELDQVIELLTQNWPSVVTFGSPVPPHLLEGVVPTAQREVLIQKLYQACVQLLKSNIASDQKSNAINALKSIIANLKTYPWDQENHQVLKEFVSKMDQVKHVTVKDHCKFLAGVLDFCA
jgi:sulfatase maturation enzyme AslB (radical SAM superfamily)